MMRWPLVLMPIVVLWSCSPPPSSEEVEWTWTDSVAATRISLNFPSSSVAHRPQELSLILYALPNGNTIEQTKGCTLTEGMDWHYGIQHIAAQTRYLRHAFPDRPIAIAYLEAAGLSWPRWRSEHAQAGVLIRRIVDSLRTLTGNARAEVTLTGHSGGGSFIFGFFNACDSIPGYVERISFLDSNYGFADSAGHTDKLLRWLRADSSHVLSVIAYDDREIVLNGKKVIGPDGGTYRRTLDMARCFGASVELTGSRDDSLLVIQGLGGHIELLIHLNSSNEILHTRLVGEMNGFLHAMTVQRRPVIPLSGPALYGDFILNGQSFIVH
jgi:hypothetical protein